MASERQLRANRANASRSTGPRSRAGKQRASKNATRHGLSVDLRGCHQETIELVARELIDDVGGIRRREAARSLAYAVLELERVSRTKLSLIKRILSVGRLHRSYVLTQIDPIIFTRREIAQIDRALSRNRMPRLRRVKAPAPLPEDQPSRIAEAFRRSLPELMAIDRYERDASGRFDQALREIMQSADRAVVVPADSSS